MLGIFIEKTDMYSATTTKDSFITRNELMGKTHRYTDAKGWGKVRGSVLES